MAQRFILCILIAENLCRSGCIIEYFHILDLVYNVQRRLKTPSWKGLSFSFTFSILNEESTLDATSEYLNMKYLASLVFIIASVVCLVQAKGPVKITFVDVRVYPHSYFSSLEYSAAFGVRLDARNEIWICNVGEVTDGSTEWVSFFFSLADAEGENNLERRPVIFVIAGRVLSEPIHALGSN